MVISVRVPDEEADKMKVYAVYKGVSVSELLRDTMRKELDQGYHRITPRENELVREKIAYEARKKKRRKKKRMKMKQAQLEKELRESQMVLEQLELLEQQSLDISGN